MNPPTASDLPPSTGSGDEHPRGESPYPSNWREALLSLIASRVELIQLESKEAATHGARRAALMIAAVICVFFTWSLLLAGGIAAISRSTGWPWYWTAMAAAAVHLLLAVILARSAKSTESPSFPYTRAEFKKDREWIENFHKTRKSND
jgi:uncharacterized membrane protein YqjE